MTINVDTACVLHVRVICRRENTDEVIGVFRVERAERDAPGEGAGMESHRPTQRSADPRHRPRLPSGASAAQLATAYGLSLSSLKRILRSAGAIKIHIGS